MLVVVVAAAVAAGFGAWGAGSALAYGSQDGPLAQVEISANCDNSTFGLCQEVGLGGVWSWAELDTSSGGGTFADPSTMDFTLSGCHHTIGGGGPGTAGAHGGTGSGIWYQEPNLTAALSDVNNPVAFPFYDTSTYSGPVYVLDYLPGSGVDDFIAIVPAGQGNYSFHPANGVTIQTQIAP